MIDARGDRRQRAAEAAIHGIADPTKFTPTVAKAVEAAVEVAAQVRITPDLLDAFGRAWHEADRAAEREGTRVSGTRRAAGLRAAFEAAGFEVER